MSESVSLRYFKKHIDDYCQLRLDMNHQPSSVAAARKDLRAMTRFMRVKKHRTIDGNKLIGFVTWLSQECKNNAGTINRKISSVKSYLKHLRLRNTPGSFSVHYEYLQRARDAYKGPIYTLKVEEVIRILESFDTSFVLGQRDRVLFTLMYGCGLRIGEAVGIKIEDIDFQNETILINGKGKRQRIIPLLKHQLKMLEEWLDARENLLNANKSSVLFLSKKGNQLSVRRAQEIFKEAVESLGEFSIKRVVPHTLRHAFASHAVESNCELIVLKAILGHAYLKTTEMYVHPSIETQREAMNNHLANEQLGSYRRVYCKRRIQPGRKAAG